MEAIAPQRAQFPTHDKTWRWTASAASRIARRLCVRTHRELVSAQFELRGPVEFRSVWMAANSIGGFSTDRAESMLLYCLAKNGPADGVIVEIGSYLGRSTAFLAMGSKRAGRGKVIAIDPHRGGSGDPGSEDSGVSASLFPMFLHHMRRVYVDDWVIPVRLDAVQAAEFWPYGAIRVLFIDGLHTYDTVRQEIATFRPLLADGAIVVFDDYYPPDFPGVRQAVDEALASNVVPRPRRRVNRFAVCGLTRIWDVVHD